MVIRLKTNSTGAIAPRLRAFAALGEPSWPHVGECGSAGDVRSRDGMRIGKQSNGGRVSAAGEAM